MPIPSPLPSSSTTLVDDQQNLSSQSWYEISFHQSMGVTLPEDMAELERKLSEEDFYSTYDPMTGIRVAATLGGFILFFGLFLLYKNRCRKKDYSKNKPEITSSSEAKYKAVSVSSAPEDPVDPSPCNSPPKPSCSSYGSIGVPSSSYTPPLVLRTISDSSQTAQCSRSYDRGAATLLWVNKQIDIHIITATPCVSPSSSIRTIYATEEPFKTVPNNSINSNPDEISILVPPVPNPWEQSWSNRSLDRTSEMVEMDLNSDGSDSVFFDDFADPCINQTKRLIPEKKIHETEC